MKQTENRGYPYPECDPPLTKDASDIAQMRDLAMAIDQDVQNVYNRAESVVIRPPSARMTMSAAAPGTGSNTMPVYNVRSWDTTGTAMTDLTFGEMRLPEPGWYIIGADIQMTAATSLNARIRFMLDGAFVTTFSPSSSVGSGSTQLLSTSATVFAADAPDDPTPGVPLSLFFKIQNIQAFTFTSRIWATRVSQV